ncbi:YebC/PmpR family DNA-binding transcriptional regulator [Candidatus Uhrbacteria bacterium]|nr:YebC/PmpR family DNA-binding transcriptional regulator [Candidatus Uhrbacteria bacterium]
MSGHSKWATIKRQKAVTDKKKGAAFTKLSKILTVAARAGGDPTMNFKLATAIEKAREANMPSDTIDRAIKRGTGELGGAQIETITYEGFGPGKAAVIVETLTDNKNRTVSNLKHIFSSHGGALGNSSSVMWMFERKGVIMVPFSGLAAASGVAGGSGGAGGSLKDDFELKAIEAGAQDIKEEAEFLIIYTAPEELTKVKGGIEALGVKIESSELEYIGKEQVKISDEVKAKLEALFEELDVDDDVQNFYTNAEV